MLLTPHRNRAARDAAIRSALTLRAPALALLAGRPLDDAHRAALGVNAVAWHIFLSAECCAVAIASALRRSGAWDALAPDVRAAVAAAESREIQRVITARAQLAEIDAVAAALDLRPIVLKGGAVVGEGAPVDLGDLDLLAPRDVITLLAPALLARGHTQSDVLGLTLVRPGALPIELHTSVPYGRVPVPLQGDTADRSPIVPLAGYCALRRLIGAPALMMLLRHSVLSHPFRRGHLRDLVVIADALGRCTADEVEAVARVCADDPHGPELAETLALAQAVHAGCSAPDTPAIRRVAAHKYLAAAGAWTRVARIAPRWPALLCEALDRRTARRVSFRTTLVSDMLGVNAGSPWACGRLGRVAPRATAALITPARVVYRATLFSCAIVAGPFARRRVARLLA